MDENDSPLTSPRSSAPTEPLPNSDDEAPLPVYDNMARRPTVSTPPPVPSTSTARLPLPVDQEGPGEEEDDDGPPSKVYGHTRPIGLLKARRRAANDSDSSLTTQSDSDDQPLAARARLSASPKKVPSPPKAAKKSRKPSISSDDLSDLPPSTEAVAVVEQKQAKPSYRTRPGKLAKVITSLPPTLLPAREESSEGTSALDTPVSPRLPLADSPPIVNGRKRRRGSSTSSNSAKSARLSVEREAVEETMDVDEASVKVEEPVVEVEPEVEETPIEMEEEPVAVEEPMQATAEPDEVEAEVDLEASPELDGQDEDPALTDISNRIRLEAMEELTRIEIKFAKVRERLFAERTGANEREHNAIMNGTHPDMLHLTQLFEQRRASKLHLAKQMYDNSEQMYAHQLAVQERMAWSWWQDEREALHRRLYLDTTRKRKQYERDLNADRQADAGYSGLKFQEIYDEHNRRRQMHEEAAEEEYAGYLDYYDQDSTIKGLSAHDVSNDLSRMLVRESYVAPFSSHRPSSSMHSFLPFSNAAPVASTSAALFPPRSMPTSLPTQATYQPRSASISGTLPSSFPEPSEAIKPRHQPSHLGSSPRSNHSHRPSLDAHMATAKVATPPPAVNTSTTASSNPSPVTKFVLPPIPPFAGGTRTHADLAPKREDSGTPAPAFRFPPVVSRVGGGD